MADRKSKIRGLSLRKLNYCMAVITLVISVLLLISTYQTAKGYRKMRDATENYIVREQCATDLQNASDYLTDQVQCFAVTGKLSYLENYFTEAKVTKRRDKALDLLKDELEGSRAYQSLEKAMSTSVHLMEREYYSMRLMVDARGYDLSTLPEEIGNVKLSEKDAALSASEKELLAAEMVHDEIYHLEKDAISRETVNCLGSLIDETERAEADSVEALHGHLIRQQVLIILIIATVVVVIVLTSLQVIGPLVKAIPEIRADKPLPVEGAYEYRYLAATYNQMYENNRERRRRLAYKASHDKLTGLYNRSGYDELCRSTTLVGSALIIIDIDDFKKINDSYGHGVGDIALKRLTKAMQEVFRAEDMMFRVGGDEFVVIVEEVGKDYAQVIVEKIARINRKLEEPLEDCPPLSVTAGVAFGEAGADPAELFKQADTALYRVKGNGKHGCGVYDEQDAQAFGKA